MIKKCIVLITLLFMYGGLQASMTDESILVVGAGPAGLSTVKALRNKGFGNIDIIEQNSTIRFDGSGFAVPANADWALRKLGIDLTSKAIPVSQMQFTDDQGECLKVEDISQIHPEGAQFYALTREDLMHALLESIESTPIQTGVTIRSLLEEEDKISVEFSNNTSKSYSWIFACDGIHSALRKTTHPEEIPESLDLFVWRTLIDAPLGLKMPTYMMGSGQLALIYPMPSKKAYIYGHLVITPEASVSLITDPIFSFEKTFSSFGGLMPQVLETIRENPPHFYTHTMEKSHSVRFASEKYRRLLFIGDASHAFGPMLQNGAAQAFEDAYVIQELVDKTNDILTLINAFSERRKKRVQSIFDMSNQKIKAISDPSQIETFKAFIRTNGAPNVNGFKLIMRENP